MFPLRRVTDCGERMKRTKTWYLETQVESTGTRPDYLSDRADKKIERPKFEQRTKKTGQSRNRCTVSGGGVGA